MTARKYISWEDAVVRGWYSRTWWKAKGVVIPADAVPKDVAWKPAQKKTYPLFFEDQGTKVPKKSAVTAAIDAFLQAEVDNREWHRQQRIMMGFAPAEKKPDGGLLPDTPVSDLKPEGPR